MTQTNKTPSRSTKDDVSPLTMPLREALLLSLHRQEKEGGPTRLQLVADALVDAAIKGNVEAAKEIFDRIEGKLPEAVSGEDGAAKVRVTFSGGWPAALLPEVVLRRQGRLVMAVARPPGGAIDA